MEEAIMWIILASLAGYFLPFAVGQIVDERLHLSHDACYVFSLVAILTVFIPLIMVVSSNGDHFIILGMIFSSTLSLNQGISLYDKTQPRA